jgi:coenzyme F420-reducing hydrogenase delta subunit
MGVGPPGRTGRDQLAAVRAFVEGWPSQPPDVVIAGCNRTASGSGEEALDGAPVLPVTCAGSLHTSVIEYLLRVGAGGVLVVSCSPRDCWNREGPKWLEQRIYHDREAELQERVDRRRVRVVYSSEAGRAELLRELAAFREAIRSLGAAGRESVIELDLECETDSADASLPGAAAS